MPAGVSDEIAYVGAERQDRYEHYEWNFRAREVVGTGVQRTDIPMRELTPAEDKHVGALLRRLGIGALADRRFLTLSYGERRLVLIARALASRPKLLLLDEVANGLDSRNHARFLTWLNGHRALVDALGVRHAPAGRRARLDDPSAGAGAGHREAKRQDARRQGSRVVAAGHACVSLAPDGCAAPAAQAPHCRCPAPCGRSSGRSAHPHGHQSRSARRRLLGGARAEWLRQVHAAADYLRRSRRGIGRQHRARRHRSRRGAREIQVAHRIRGSAPADLAQAGDAGDGSRGVGSLREHWSQ